MKFEIHNIETKVSGKLEEILWLSSFLTFADTSESFFMSDGRAGFSGTKTKHFFHQGRQTFPTGLAALARRAAIAEKFEVQFVDHRERPASIDEEVDLGWLRERCLLDGSPFQYDAVMRLGVRSRGLLHLPTGGGKTEAAVGLMKSIDCRWLFLAPEADLMHQAAKRWELRCPDEPVGRLGDGHSPRGDERIVCATIQTLSRRLSDPGKAEDTRAFLESFQGLVVDENQCLASPSAYAVAMATSNAYYRVGMSGTTLARGDQKNMYIIAALGEVVYRLRAKELIAAGWVAQPRVTMVPVTQPGSDRKTFAGVYSHRVVASAARNRVVVSMASKAEKPCLVFVRFKKHGLALLKMLRQSGSRVEFLHGTHKTNQRDQALRTLEWGDLDIIVCTKILQTGTDIPELRSVVNGAGGASILEVIQRVGRGMRIVRNAAGELVKRYVDVWDILDVDGKQLNPETGRMNASKSKWLVDQSKTRVAAYEGEEYPVKQLTAIEAREYGSEG